MKTNTLKLSHWEWKFGKLYKIFITVFLFTFTSFQSYSQTLTQELQEMRLIGELPGHVDVKFKVVKCENSTNNQVFLWLHNESERYNAANDTTSNFDIVILNYENGESFTQNITISTTIGQIITADCENDSPLKIDLPETYSPSSIAAHLINTEN